jgi:hypothetical protein
MSTRSNLWKDDKGFIWMLVISVLMLVSTQVTESIFGGDKLLVRIGFFIFTLVAVKSSSLSIIRKSIGYTISAAILVLAIVLTQTESQGISLLYAILIACYMIFIVALVVSQIFASAIITTYKIAGGVAAYIIVGHIWATLYVAIYIMSPDSFQYGGQPIQSDEALKQLSYFSFVTLTTIGYGDITAISSTARIFVMMEGLLGQLFPAIFIAKLVSQQIEDSRKK